MRRNPNIPSSSPVETRSASGDESLPLHELRETLGAVWTAIHSLGKRRLNPDERRELDLIRIKSEGLARLSAERLRVADRAAEPVKAGGMGFRPGQDEVRADVSGVRVLLCKPEQSNHAAIGQMLRHLGAKVTISEGLADALDLCAAQTFDAVILLLPEAPEAATEFIRRFREVAGSRGEMPVLAVASVRARADLRRLEALGADEVVEAPIADVWRLGQALARAIGLPTGAGSESDLPASAGPRAARADAGMLASLEGLLVIAGDSPRPDILMQLERDLAGTSEQLHEAVQAWDPERIRRAAHVLVSLAGTSGAGTLEAIAREIGRLSREGEPGPRVQGLAEEAAREISAVCACIDGILTGLGDTSPRSGR